MISLLDYGAGNVRSLRNAIQALGFSLTEIERPEDILKAERLIFPGVGAFGAAMQRLHAQGYVEPLKQYLCLAGSARFDGEAARRHLDGYYASRLPPGRERP